MPERPLVVPLDTNRVEHTPRHTNGLAAFRAALGHDSAYLDYLGAQIPFADIDRDSDRLAQWALAHGVVRGDRIGIILHNVPSFVIAVVAAWKIGAVPVPGNPAYRKAEFARVFSDSTPSFVICHDAHQADIGAALAMASLQSPVLTVSPYDHAGVPDSRLLPPPFEGDQGMSLFEVIAAPAPPPPPLEARPEEMGLLLYTSGTTGQPKGAMLSHRGLASNGQLMGEWCGVHGNSRILGIAPFFHITGFVCHMLMAFAMRCALLISYRFDAPAVLDIIRRTRPTYTVGAVTVFNALAGIPGVSHADFESFESVYSGGAPIAPALHEYIRERLGVRLHNCYGMTETSAPTHLTPLGFQGPVDPLSGSLSIGVPLWGTAARIVSEDGQDAASRETGELWLKGPQVMAGYWRKPAETAEALQDHWLRSGDVGFKDEAGWFYLVDRKKDMIVASGFKVWPREVEDALYTHEAIREAAVIGEPDAYRGETVVAYVSVRADKSVTPEALIGHCRELLAGYKCPREVRVLSELPKTLSGKIQRSALREQH
jgi:long-chain acyl-CoA synthetase